MPKHIVLETTMPTGRKKLNMFHNGPPKQTALEVSSGKVGKIF